MKPDRDMDPPDQYNRRKVRVIDPFQRAVEDANTIYRAGMNLPPLERVEEEDENNTTT